MTQLRGSVVLWLLVLTSVIVTLTFALGRLLPTPSEIAFQQKLELQSLLASEAFFGSTKT